MANKTPSLYTSQTTPSTTSTPPSSFYPTNTTTSTSTTRPYPPPQTQASPPKFEYPRTHAFPPFYTLQPQSSTLHAQLQKWSSLILAYHAFHKITKLSISAALNSELFWNRQIDRRLDEKGVREVLEFMRKDGRVEFVKGGVKGEARGDGDVCWIWWRSVEEWGVLIESWVEETAQKNTVLTLYELTQSDTTLGQDFHGMDPELLQKALSLLVKRGKAQIFGQEDQQGVKFF